MDIINENIPYENEKINLLLTSSLLQNSNDIIYNLNNKNFILIDNYYLEYSSIHIDLNPINNKLSLILENSLINKDDYSLIILTDSDSESNIYLNNLQKIFNKNKYQEHNINSISINYSYINEKNKKYKTNDLSNIPNIENNNIFIKIKIKYNNDLIYTSFKIFIINNCYQKICPLLCINHKEYELNFIKDKINKLLLEEKKFSKIINNMPILNEDFIEKINIYKMETFDYFNKFIKTIEKMSNKFNNNPITKNDFNSFIKEINNFMDKINKDNYKNKENDIYKEYIKVYNNVEQINISNKNKNLKSLLITFNNLNEEIANLLEKNDMNKKEVSNLKNIIKVVQNQLKEEKSKKNPKKRSFIDNNAFNTIENNILIPNNSSLNNTRNSKRFSLSKNKNFNRSVSVRRYHRNSRHSRHSRNSRSIEKTLRSKNKSYNNLKTIENDDFKYNRKIHQLNDLIAHLKSKNETLEKSNEKMRKDIRTLNKIISKLQRNIEENNSKNELLPMQKSSSIKTFLYKKKSHGKDKFISSSNKQVYNNSIILDNIKNNDSLQYSHRTKNSNTNITNNNYDETKHLKLLKKIYDENKNLFKTINTNNNNNNNYTNSEIGILDKDINKGNNYESNTTVKREKKKRKIFNNNINFYTNKKDNKSSAPKIKIYKSNNQK